MGPDLEKAINEISLRMRLLRAQQDDESSSGALSEREELIIRLLLEKGSLTVSGIADAAPQVSYSTISTTITKLWRDKKLVSKTISPESQRVTIVELTDKGREVAVNIMKLQSVRYQTLIQALMLTSEEKELLLKIINRAVMFFDKQMASVKSST